MGKITSRWVGLLFWFIGIAIGSIYCIFTANWVFLVGIIYFGTLLSIRNYGMVCEYTQENFFAVPYMGENYGSEIISKRGMGSIPVEEILKDKQTELEQLRQKYLIMNKNGGWAETIVETVEKKYRGEVMEEEGEDFPTEYYKERKDIEIKYELFKAYLLPQYHFIKCEYFGVITAFDAKQQKNFSYWGRIETYFLDGVQGAYNLDGDYPIFVKTKIEHVTDEEAREIESVASENKKLKERIDELNTKYDKWFSPEMYESEKKEKEQFKKKTEEILDDIEDIAYGFTVTGEFKPLSKFLVIPKPTKQQLGIGLAIFTTLIIGILMWIFYFSPQIFGIHLLLGLGGLL